MEKAILESLVNAGYSQRRIGAELQVGQCSVRYWLKKHALKTVRAKHGNIVGTERTCRECKRKYVYLIEKGHQANLCNSCEQSLRRRRFTKMAIEHKGGRCVLCGFTGDHRAFDFHHRNPTEKDYNLSARIGRYSWEKLKKELDKCDLLCANCHRCVDHKVLMAL